jgi:hypothetical protein
LELNGKNEDLDPDLRIKLVHEDFHFRSEIDLGSESSCVSQVLKKDLFFGFFDESYSQALGFDKYYTHEGVPVLKLDVIAAVDVDFMISVTVPVMSSFEAASVADHPHLPHIWHLDRQNPSVTIKFPPLYDFYAGVPYPIGKRYLILDSHASTFSEKCKIKLRMYLNYSQIKPIHPKPVETFNIYNKPNLNTYTLDDYIAELDRRDTKLTGEIIAEPGSVEQPSPESEPLGLEQNQTITGVVLPDLFKPRFADQMHMPGLRLEFDEVEQFTIPIVSTNYHKFIRDMIKTSIMYKGIPTITLKMVAAKMSAARFRIWVSDRKDSKFSMRTYVNELYSKNRFVK